MGPDVNAWVHQNLRTIRAPLRAKMVFTSAGRQIVHEAGEMRILGPNGEPIKVVTDENGGTVITTDETQGVHLRPPTLSFKMSVEQLRGG